MPDINLLDAIKTVKEQIPYMTDKLLKDLSYKIEEEIHKRKC